MASFAKQLATISARINVDVELLGKAIVLEVFTRVQGNTRVDTGRAKGNWQVTTRSPADAEVERFDQSSKGTSGVDFVLEADKTIDGLGLNFLTNNLDYITFLEEKDGMVVSAVADLDRIVKDAAR